MVIAGHWRATFPGSAMRVDQCLRIDLEMGFRRGMNICGGLDRGDAIPLPQQDAAAFEWVGRMRFGLELKVSLV